MSPRTRVVAIVAVVAVVVAAAVVGVTLLQTRGASTGTTALKGVPPLYLPASTALRLYEDGKRSRAEALFARSKALPDEIGAAFARWPHGTLDTMKSIVAAHPESALAELHLGLAYFWSGRDADAASSWLRAAKVEPDTPYAVTALDFLHPGVAPGLPLIVVDPRSVGEPARSKLVAGIRLWSAERPISGRRTIEAALALAPDNPVVRTAAAVTLYSPAMPLAPFPKLGPLTAAFPKAAVVRFHLGELLLWTRQVKKGEAQLRIAVATEPGSVYAQAADKILGLLRKDGTK